MSREQVVDAYLHGAMSRRTFVRRMTALGMSLGAALAYVDLLRPEQARAALPPELYDSLLAPTAATATATAVTQVQAILNATVDPNLNTTTVAFQWGTDPAALGQTLAAAAQEGNGDRDVAALLTGLTPGTAYSCRVTASSVRGQVTGSPVSFTTLLDPPQAVTAAATDVTGTSAVLRGTVDPDLQATDVRFEWGTAPGALTQTLPAAQQTGDGDREVSVPLTGLAQATSYSFRIVARNASGEVAGPVQSFTTLDTTAPALTVTVPGQTAAGVIARGLQVTVTSPEDATVVLELVAIVPGPGGRGVRRIVVAKRRVKLKKRRRTRLRVRRNRKGLAILRRRGVRYELRQTATDAAGNTTTVTRPVTFG